MNKENTQSTAFIEKTFDEFNDTSSIKHIGHWGNAKLDPMIIVRLHLGRTKDVESLALQCMFRAREWFFAKNGEIIFNCDQENIRIAFHETSSDVKTESDRPVCYENGFYMLDREIMSKICEAKVLKFRITGGKSYEQYADEQAVEFQIFCRQFYNNVFDPAKYPEAVAKGVNKSGCFVATAVMGDNDDPVVVTLREFRDCMLQNYNVGRYVVRVYYRLSPPLADWIRHRTFARLLTKWIVVMPSSKLAAALLHRNMGKRRR